MSATAPIIDVKPIDCSSTRIYADTGADAHGRARAQAGAGDYSGVRAQAQGSKAAPGFGGVYAAKSPVSAIGGLMQMVLGASLMAIGIPMLVLPGPGLFSIALGGFLVSRGIRNLKS